MKTTILCTSALVLTGMAPLLTGCHSNAQQSQLAPIVDGNANSTDPASANLLPVAAAPGYGGNQPAPVSRVAASQYATAPQSSSETYPAQAGASYGAGNGQQNEAYQYNTQAPQGQPQYDANGNPITAQEYDQYADLLDPNVPAATQPPPALPADYDQPEAPGPDYLWTPGYWDYASAGYYYVPGTWVAAPYSGALWTPGWWGFGGGHYRWHHGYWGRHVGYYGGINYGFGFIGFGYQGGYWNGDHFFYNRAVNRINPRVVNNYVYERRVSVINNTYINNTRVSYVGGQGGLRRGPAPQEFAALHEQRTPPMQAQIANRQAAAQNRQQFYNANNGRPAMLAVSRPLAADRNVAPPPRFTQGQGFNGGRPEGNQPGGNLNPQQRQQFEQQQRVQTEQQRQQFQQNNQRQQFEQQQRVQNEQQRQQFQQNNQRQQFDQQRVQTEQQRQQFQQNNQRQQEANRQQQFQQNNQRQQLEQQQRVQAEQQRVQAEQQRQQQTQADQQRQQADQQRQAEQQRQQQLQVNNQRQQQVQDQQRNQQLQQRQAEQEQNLQRQQQGNTQREQGAMQQRQQFDAGRQQQLNQPRPQQAAPQANQARPAPAAVPRVEAPRPAPAPQHVEAPRPAPPPHMEAPHAAPPAAHAEPQHR